MYFGQKSPVSAMLGFVALLLSGRPAFAHVSERALVQLLPTQVYITAGVTAVFLTFVLLVVFPVGWMHRLFGSEPEQSQSDSAPINATLPAPAHLVSIGSFVVFWTLVSFGLTGTHDPLENLLPLTLLTVWWILLPLFQAVFGDIWRWINPWTGPAHLAFPEKPLLCLPPWLGVWPALLAFSCAALYALTDIAPMDPERLAVVAAGYWLFTFVMIGVFGPVWLERGEGFSLFFSLFARLAPIRLWPLLLRFPGRLLIQPPFPDISIAVFSVSLLAIGSFDGLNETFWWVVQLGHNPLEFPGRSAVVTENRIGLIGAVLVLNLIFAVTVWLGLLLIGRRELFKPLYCRLSLSVLPIALGYHFAHFLNFWLLNIQYFVLALSDPFANGANLLGLKFQYVTNSMFNQLHSVRLIWLGQAAGIVGGHILAVILAHAIALKVLQHNRLAVISQIPIAIFMSIYTLFGLWLLATPTAF